MHMICPPKFCISIVSISLGTAVMPRGNEKQRLCKILGANELNYARDVQVAQICSVVLWCFE